MNRAVQLTAGAGLTLVSVISTERSLRWFDIFYVDTFRLGLISLTKLNWKISESFER